MELIRINSKEGILKYFEDTPASQWNGECFVFDYRVSVDKQLQPGSNELCFGCNMPITPEEKKSPHYEEGFTCPVLPRPINREEETFTD